MAKNLRTYIQDMEDAGELIHDAKFQKLEKSRGPGAVLYNLQDFLG